jgi:anti-anti-sigma factor
MPIDPASRDLPRNALGKLVLPGGEEKLLTEHGLTAGRVRENDIWLDDPSVSRQHARFESIDGKPAVRDLNSTNGTFVNGSPVYDVRLISHGDSIQLGDVAVLFLPVARPAAATPGPAAAPPKPAPPPKQPVRPRAAPPSPPAAPAPPAPAQAAPPSPPAAPAPPARPPVAAPPKREAAPAAASAVSSAPVEAAPAAAAPPAPPAPAAPAPSAAPSPSGAGAAEVTRHQVLTLPGGITAVELTPVGALSIETAEAFRQLVESLLDTGISRFCFDLARLEYVDSSGLAALLQLCRDARSRNGTVWFYNVTPSVVNIFELTNLRRVLKIVSTREEALAEAQEA